MAVGDEVVLEEEVVQVDEEVAEEVEGDVDRMTRDPPQRYVVSKYIR